MRSGEERAAGIQGPVMHPAVWTWEVPAYFWLGGIATGSSFVALAADVAGDQRSAAIARRVTLAAVVPCAPLLILDLGRPTRFLNMLRIFKPRSPMSMGAWVPVGLLLRGRRRRGRRPDRAAGARRKALGAATAFFGTYLGSYTGVLLASTAVPVWARSRLFLPPIFVATATATGAATNRLVLAAAGLPVGHPTRTALGTVETGAMAAGAGHVDPQREAARPPRRGARAGPAGQAVHGWPSGACARAWRCGSRAGAAGPWTHHVASVLYILSGLAFRFAWVGAGRTSAARRRGGGARRAHEGRRADAGRA